MKWWLGPKLISVVLLLVIIAADLVACGRKGPVTAPNESTPETPIDR